MKYTFKPVWSGKKKKRNICKPCSWIGPYEHIKPEARKYLKPIDKQFIFRKQSECCNFCTDKIQLYPFPNCDADHIIPICLGGKTVMNNMQLLCVQCHRNKSACESRQLGKTIDIENIDRNKVYIFSEGEDFKVIHPLNMINPTESIDNPVSMSILTFNTIDRSEKEEEEYDYINMLQKFAYNG